MALTYAERHNACETTYADRKQPRVDALLSLAISALASGLQIAEMANEHRDQDRVQFSLLAEKHIHEKGTWPKDMPYPIPRRSDGTFPTNR